MNDIPNINACNKPFVFVVAPAIKNDNGRLLEAKEITRVSRVLGHQTGLIVIGDTCKGDADHREMYHVFHELSTIPTDLAFYVRGHNEQCTELSEPLRYQIRQQDDYKYWTEKTMCYVYDFSGFDKSDSTVFPASEWMVIVLDSYGDEEAEPGNRQVDWLVSKVMDAASVGVSVIVVSYALRFKDADEILKVCELLSCVKVVISGYSDLCYTSGNGLHYVGFNSNVTPVSFYADHLEYIDPTDEDKRTLLKYRNDSQ